MSNEHYDAGGIPVIDVIRAKLTQEQYEGYLLGQIIKYSLRLNFKDSKEQDAGKLADYAQWLDESHWKESPLATSLSEEQQRFQRENERTPTSPLDLISPEEKDALIVDAAENLKRQYEDVLLRESRSRAGP